MPEEQPRTPPTRTAFAGVADFVQHLRFADLPDAVVRQARRCLLDLIGVAAAGSRTSAAQIACNYAAAQLRSSDSEGRMLFDGRHAGAAGIAFAGAAMIDAFDAHDGHVLTKGHAGVAVLPALLAFVDSGAACDDREFITCIVLGYEVATRAGIALHSSVTDYHSSGAWNAIGCAAIGARLLGLSDAQMRHALGIAEYWGPRSQIMRVCDSPSMVKDGSSWGAHSGVSAALLARAGFSGARMGGWSGARMTTGGVPRDAKIVPHPSAIRMTMPAWLTSSATTSQPQMRRLPAMVSRSGMLMLAFRSSQIRYGNSTATIATPATQGPTVSICARPYAVAIV